MLRLNIIDIYKIIQQEVFFLYYVSASCTIVNQCHINLILKYPFVAGRKIQGLERMLKILSLISVTMSSPYPQSTV